MNLHPQFIGQDGSDQYVVLPLEEFRAITEALEDYQDWQDLRSAREAEGTATSTPLANVVKQLDIDNG